jgi:DNA-binding GntR family transcriptional regulator
MAGCWLLVLVLVLVGEPSTINHQLVQRFPVRVIHPHLYLVYRIQMVTDADVITRRTLVDEAADRLRDWIVSGKLSEADRLSEPALAEKLGISRTPLREAISRLEHEGFLETETGRSVRIRPLSEELVREIYPVTGALEAIAVRITPAKSFDVARLRALNDEIAAPRTSKARLYAADRELHRLFSAGCGNPRLLDLLENHRRLAARFDGAFRRGLHARERSHAQHEAIIHAIERGRTAAAASLIQEHYLSGIDVVIDWLRKS